MARLLGVVGESSTGKSTSMENLNPEETYIINVLGKDLPFKGFKSKWSAEKKNLANTSNWNKISQIIKGVADSRPDIKNIIIDDATFIMTEEFMSRAQEPGLT